ncbi:PepSY domain-containing protein [Orrella sp. 11846]|uniref:PepSY domain-containing protein n=1 Tax=Orrella sp. 11846 TaxID=3409913 RepID=UPI003B59CD86
MTQFFRKPTRLLATSLLALSAATLSVPTFAQNKTAAGQPALTSGTQGHWVTMREVQDKLEASHKLQIREIKRKHYGYKVKARDEAQRKVKLYIEPREGSVVYVDYDND